MPDWFRGLVLAGEHGLQPRRTDRLLQAHIQELKTRRLA